LETPLVWQLCTREFPAGRLNRIEISAEKITRVIACEVVGPKQEGGREVVTIVTERQWHIEATTGQTQFEVGPIQIIEFDWGSSPGDTR
jgi:hypothetical protein